METAGLKNVQVKQLRFTPETEAASFAAASSFLIKGKAARLWPEVFRSYGEEILAAFERCIRENCQDVRWNGTVVALLATGGKEGECMDSTWSEDRSLKDGISGDRANQVRDSESRKAQCVTFDGLKAAFAGQSSTDSGCPFLVVTATRDPGSDAR